MNWQSIETAPRHGRILVCGTEIGTCVASAGWDNETPEKVRWEVVNDIAVTPTHWMPLPPAPGEKCRTCNGHGAVGNILTAEPCQDCTPAPAAPVGWTDDQMIRFASQILRHGATSDSIEQRLGRFRGDEEFRGLDTPKAAFAVTAAAKESP